jgi:molecular chaperone HtpG
MKREPNMLKSGEITLKARKRAFRECKRETKRARRREVNYKMEDRLVAVVATNDHKVKVMKTLLHIPNDIVFSILSKLSIKSLKRFKCVCKSWSLLFDNHYFMTMYRNYLLSKDHSCYDDTSILLHTASSPWDVGYWDDTFVLFCIFGDKFENKVQLDWPRSDSIKHLVTKYYSGFNILSSGSVNGILCLLCVMLQNVIMWNPSTKEVKVIPPSPIPIDGRGYRSFNIHGFGYDPVKDDYKLLRHVQNVESYKRFWEIYSLRSNSWRKLDVDMPNECRARIVQLYMDGLSHWMCKSETHNENYLLSFDWSNEVFITTPIPSDMNDDMNDYRLVWSRLLLLNGSIALILKHKETATFHISILGELGVKESWTKIFIVGPLPSLEQLVGMGKKGDMFFKKKDGELVWFDLNTHIIKDLGVFTHSYYCKVVIHKENLISFEG